jgi:F-type H+-transporting ATPase subunit delta
MSEYVNEYASALFDLLIEENKVEQNYLDLQVIAKTITENTDMVKLVNHPQVTKNDKKSLIQTIYSEVDPILLNFLYVLIDNRRLHQIKEISDRFVVLYKEYNQILTVKVVTSIPLTEKQKNELNIRLTRKYHKMVEITNEIDPTVMGGMRLMIKDEIIDDTVSNRLSSLKSYVLNQN